MSRLAVAILVALALARTCQVCDAGVLGFLGEKTEQLRNDTRVIVEEAGKRIKGLFGREEEGPRRTEAETASAGNDATLVADDESSTQVPAREIFAIVPRCGGDEIWDKDTRTCVPELR